LLSRQGLDGGLPNQSCIYKRRVLYKHDYFEGTALLQKKFTS